MAAPRGREGRRGARIGGRRRTLELPDTAPYWGPRGTQEDDTAGDNTVVCPVHGTTVSHKPTDDTRGNSVTGRSDSVEDCISRLKTLTSGRINDKMATVGDDRGYDLKTCFAPLNPSAEQPTASPRTEIRNCARRLAAISNERCKTTNGAGYAPVPTHDTRTRDDVACGSTPRVWFAVACFTATLTFLFAVNTDFLPPVRSVALDNLLPEAYVTSRDDPLSVICVIVMWGVHFLRRFTEILFLHDYRRAVRPAEAVWFNLVFPGMGFWIGWSCNYFTRYRTPSNHILLPATLLFIVGEIGNCVCHVTLRRLRNDKHAHASSPSGHVVPSGGLFRYTWFPHYGFEAVTWAGFALAVFTLPGFVFLGANLVVLCVYVGLRRRGYRREFAATGDPNSRTRRPKL